MTSTHGYLPSERHLQPTNINWKLIIQVSTAEVDGAVATELTQMVCFVSDHLWRHTQCSYFISTNSILMKKTKLIDRKQIKIAKVIFQNISLYGRKWYIIFLYQKSYEIFLYQKTDEIFIYQKTDEVLKDEMIYMKNFSILSLIFHKFI